MQVASAALPPLPKGWSLTPLRRTRAHFSDDIPQVDLHLLRRHPARFSSTPLTRFLAKRRPPPTPSTATTAATRRARRRSCASARRYLTDAPEAPPARFSAPGRATRGRASSTRAPRARRVLCGRVALLGWVGWGRGEHHAVRASRALRARRAAGDEAASRRARAACSADAPLSLAGWGRGRGPTRARADALLLVRLARARRQLRAWVRRRVHLF
jgi:hypothetical protein